MYVFLPTKFELPANAAADRATAALEDFTTAIKQPTTKQIPFKAASINKAIDALTALLSPKQATTNKNTVASPRVGTMHAPRPRVNARQKEQERPRVNNKQQERVLRPRRKEIPQKYSRGTYVYKAFNNKIH